eukprot:jgi/Mesen1/7794/ME000408S06902
MTALQCAAQFQSGLLHQPTCSINKNYRVVSAAMTEEASTGTNSFTFSQGKPAPLGPSEEAQGVNFALFSQNATGVSLCLYLDGRQAAPSQEIKLDAKNNKSGDVWHISVEGLPKSGVLYGFRVEGPSGWDQGHRFDPSAVLLDPYAPLVDSRRKFGDSSDKFASFLGTYTFDEKPFDWGEDDPSTPVVAEKDMVVYEMNVRAFTQDESSGLDPEVRGSYRGLIEKIPHLMELGVTSVELLPVFEYDEFEFQLRPNPRDHLVNTWGYSTINFFAPMSRYASGGGGPVAAANEFKEMVKALHAAGIEVLLDVVYNHTNEADDAFPYLTSFRGIDNAVYYMVDLNSYVQLSNYAGCGNTMNCNHPVVMQLILDSLRHWVTEYHVDGFRFDLASVLCRGTDGAPLDAPPLIRAIAKDEVLSRCKLISEPWDCAGLYLVGKFPNWDRYASGDPGMKSEFATRISGSADLYHTNNRKPYHSVNFVIAHDGFTLMDLVSYNSKHNEANGEEGRDGSNDNLSWNCGAEGSTDDPEVRGLRLRQMKNFHLVLMISQGTPMMLMGDEYGHSRGGNNNSYGHDSALNHFQWNQLEENRGVIFDFFSKAIAFRKSHPLLGRSEFLSDGDVTWHEDQWDNPESRFLSFTLHEGSLGGGDIYAAFNAHTYFVDVPLPSPPPGKTWLRVVDTNLPGPDDFVPEGVSGLGQSYNVAPFSSIMLLAKAGRGDYMPFPGVSISFSTPVKGDAAECLSTRLVPLELAETGLPAYCHLERVVRGHRTLCMPTSCATMAEAAM